MFYFLSLFSLKVVLEECILKFTKGIWCTRLSAGNLYSSTLIELNFAIIVEYISFLLIKKFTFPDVSTPVFLFFHTSARYICDNGSVWGGGGIRET